MKYLLSCVFAIVVYCALAYDCNYPTRPTIQVTCPLTFNTTFTRIGQKYYYIPEHKASWFGAAHICRQIGGDLALIESAEEMNAISSHLMGNGYDGNKWLWISGNDLAITSNFMSITNGMPLPFYAWSNGQPDFPGQEQCVHLWLRDGSFKMNNWQCREKAFYICQKYDMNRCGVNC